MKKIIIVLSFCILSILSFAQVNDNVKLLNKEEIKAIKEKIVEIKEEKDISIFVNTFDEDIGFVIENPEKTCVLSLKKIAEGKYKTELSFSKDLDVEEHSSDIDGILTDTKKLLEEKKYSEYINTILDAVNSILDEVSTDPLEEMSLTKEETTNKIGKTYYWVAGIMSILLIMIYFIAGKRNRK